MTTKTKPKPRKRKPAGPSPVELLGPRNRNLGVRRVRVADIEDAEWNFRLHPEAQAAALDGMIEESGFYGYPDCFETPRGTLKLIDGHLRKERLLAKYGPDAEIDVNVTDFDETEAKKATATKDPLAAMATTDPVKLDGLLREVQTGSEALASMLSDLAKNAGLLKSTDIVEDEIPEPPAEPITKPGDLWLLGEHRLLCGDSTKPEDVARLMGGERASLLFTSPPYGQQRDYGEAKELPAGKQNSVPLLLNIPEENANWKKLYERRKTKTNRTAATARQPRAPTATQSDSCPARTAGLPRTPIRRGQSRVGAPVRDTPNDGYRVEGRSPRDGDPVRYVD